MIAIHDRGRGVVRRASSTIILCLFSWMKRKYRNWFKKTGQELHWSEAIFLGLGGRLCRQQLFLGCSIAKGQIHRCQSTYPIWLSNVVPLPKKDGRVRPWRAYGLIGWEVVGHLQKLALLQVLFCLSRRFLVIDERKACHRQPITNLDAS